MNFGFLKYIMSILVFSADPFSQDQHHDVSSCVTWWSPIIQFRSKLLTWTVSIEIVFGCFIPSKICARARWTSPLPPAETHRTVLSLISCFAGGVFLSACLLDIIPDYLSDINMELDTRKLEVSGRRCAQARSFVESGASVASTWDLWGEDSLDI